MAKVGRKRIYHDEKRVSITCRIGREMRLLIEEESEASGRSISSVVELWLEQARVLHTLRLMHPRGPGGSFDPPRKKKALEDIQGRFPFA